jgi:creatinine amidohydrolase/Fe(II)-dependent formamide hydrolase-like protein
VPRLGERTWTELDGSGPRTVLVPVGSLEQHGPHLPLDTDTRIAAAVARRAAAGDPALLLAPPAAVTRLRAEGRDVAWVGCVVPGGDAHAGATETSILLALDPDLVRVDALESGNTAPLPELLPLLVRAGVAAASPNGVLGDPRPASAAEGERLLGELVARLRGALCHWHPDDHGRLQPPS